MYPALHRMEDKGWVKAAWGTSENNRRAKFYQLTAKGRERLAEDARDWWRYADAVGKVLKSTTSPAPA
jgi:DNA-binding PadR family transcriptional regulator